LAPVNDRERPADEHEVGEEKRDFIDAWRRPPAHRRRLEADRHKEAPEDSSLRIPASAASRWISRAPAVEPDVQRVTGKEDHWPGGKRVPMLPARLASLASFARANRKKQIRALFVELLLMASPFRRRFV
jgi:hypothetical protein